VAVEDLAGAEVALGALMESLDPIEGDDKDEEDGAATNLVPAGAMNTEASCFGRSRRPPTTAFPELLSCTLPVVAAGMDNCRVDGGVRVESLERSLPSLGDRLLKDRVWFR